jgi:hypothetical protein
MRRLFLTLAVTSVAALGLIAAGCGDDKSNDQGSAAATAESTTAHHDAAMSGAASTGAATLRASLTGLLEDHVYLAGIAIAKGVGDGLDSPTFKAAAGTLDKNSVALSDAIASVYGTAAGKQYISLMSNQLCFNLVNT